MDDERFAQIAARLEQTFGVGDDPERRRLLYRRLENWVEIDGAEAYRVIYDVALRANGARNKGRYFAKAIVAACRQRDIDLMDYDTESPF